jgi:hypothetical protein
MRVQAVALLGMGVVVSAAYDPRLSEKVFDLETLAGGTPNMDKKDVFVESFEGQHNCGITGQHPMKPRSLSFCHKFNDNACCAPAMDDENTEMFDLLTGLGLSCRLRGDIREDPIAKWYCLNCDPEQPQYVRPVEFKSVADGCPSDNRPATMLVCKDWAYEGFVANPILAGPANRFQQCGLKKSSPCLDVNEKAIPDRDRYTCGDDLVIPSSLKVTDANGTVDATLSIEAFMNADSMGPPVLDESYGFKLVDRRPCLKEELEALYDTVKPTDASYTETVRLAAQQPNCLRTYEQQMVTRWHFGGQVKMPTAMTFRDFFCSGGFANPDTEEGNPGHVSKEDCKKVRAEGVEPNDPGDKCRLPATRKEFPCCCGSWKAEKCFNSAAQLAPLWLSSVLAVGLAGLIAW